MSATSMVSAAGLAAMMSALCVAVSTAAAVLETVSGDTGDMAVVVQAPSTNKAAAAVAARK